MGELSTLQIIGIIVLVLVFGGFLWRIAKSLLKIFVVGVIIFGAIYFIKPELLNEWFGSDTTNKIEQTAEDVAKKSKPIIKKGIEKTKEVLDSAENKL